MSRVKWEASAVERELYAANGMTGRDVTRRTLAVHKRAVQLCPVAPIHGGTLRSSLRWQVLRGPKGPYGRVYTDVDYAKYVTEGTAPHDIFPKRKKALFWPGADHPVSHVHHPGTKANPFMTKALEEADK